MKKLFGVIALFCVVGFTACLETDDDYTAYENWANENIDYVDSIALDASYIAVTADWDTTLIVYMKRYNTPDTTALRPIYTSTVDVMYEGSIIKEYYDFDYDDEDYDYPYDNYLVFDNSYSLTDSLYQTTLSNVITGWQIALQYMYEGDSCTVVIPADLAYGSSATGTTVSSIPYNSTLIFDMKLVNVYRDYVP